MSNEVLRPNVSNSEVIVLSPNQWCRKKTLTDCWHLSSSLISLLFKTSSNVLGKYFKQLLEVWKWNQLSAVFGPLPVILFLSYVKMWKFYTLSLVFLAYLRKYPSPLFFPSYFVSNSRFVIANILWHGNFAVKMLSFARLHLKRNSEFGSKINFALVWTKLLEFY